MAKQCLFLKNIYDGKELVWQAGQKYLVTYEDDNTYFFGSPVKEGIGKDSEGANYIVTAERK